MEPEDINDLSRDRLARAIDNIKTALREQQEEIRAFRHTMSILTVAVGNLQDGWQDYDQALSRIDVARLGRRARRLARIMDQ